MRLVMFTSGRQDWGIFSPVADALNAAPGIELLIVSGGLHHRHGPGPERLGGIPVAEHVDSLQASDTAVAVGQAAGWTTALLSGCLERLRADALMLVGDRTETLAAAVAATCLRIPVIHIHGGEETEGAVDNACRHAITKLAHLHFVAHPEFAARVKAMGEEPARVVISGAPALDRLKSFTPLTRADLSKALGVDRLGSPLVAFTFHPTTLGGVEVSEEVGTLLEGLRAFLNLHADASIVATRPNADEGGNRAYQVLQAFAASEPRMILVETLGEAYFSLLHHADLMLGNSSSGILEAPSFGLPVVNVGDRQAGRLRGGNVIDAPLDPAAIVRALEQAVLPGTREALRALPNPYGDGNAARRILDSILAMRLELKRGLVRKAFRDNSDP